MFISKKNIEKIIGRKEIFFLKQKNLNFNNKTILILGAAGTIASEFITKLQYFNFKELILVDKNENDLTLLARNINLKKRKKSSFICMDINNVYPSFYNRLKNKNLILLNFAALKHVRSEIYEESFINMFNTNCLSPFKIFCKLHTIAKISFFFSISTDKATSPQNYMGLSKRFSEHILSFLKNNYPDVKISSTRFPNVLFSKGSISESILENTLDKKIYGIPKKIKRFFITSNEASSIIFETLNNEFDGFISYPTKKFYGEAIKISELSKKICKFLDHKVIFFKNFSDAEDYKHKIKENISKVVLTDLTKGEKIIESFISKEDESLKTKSIYLKKIKLPNSKKIDLQIKKILLSKKNFEKDFIIDLLSKINEFNYLDSDINLYEVQ